MTIDAKFAAIGECMIELRHTDANTLVMNTAGDTFNTAIYLARYRHPLHLSVDYMTALGDDPYSNMMLVAWQQEGVGTDLVQQLPDRLPGLYLVRTDNHGERKFYYYRSQAAAREMFRGPKTSTILNALLHYNYLYLSGISLAILDSQSRQQLLQLLQQAKKSGAHISFDTNYRRILWETQTIAQEQIKQALSYATVALVTFEDEQKLWGDKSLQQSAERLHQWGVAEVVIKIGAEGCFLSHSGGQEYLTAKKVTQVVDTTAAGDAFNSGYLAGRIKGFSPLEAADCGQRIAAIVISYPGAIIPQEAMPVLF